MTAPALPPLPAVPTPSNGQASTPRPAEPGAFARELQAATPSGQPPGPKPAAPPGAPPRTGQRTENGGNAHAGDGAEGEASEATDAAATTQRARTALDRWLSGLRGGREDRGVLPGQARPEAPAADETAPRVAGKGRARALDDDPDADPVPADAAALALWQRQAAEPAAAHEAPEPGADRGGVAPAAAALRRAPAGKPGDARDAADARPPLAAAAADDATGGTTRAAPPLAAAGEQAGAAGAAPGPAPQPLPGAFAAELHRAGHALAGGPAAAPAAHEVHVATPVTAPDFVPRLSGELALLARDGVQEARVQLNPAELGPIAVQITLEGQAAQVRLAVDHAFTRDLLEQAMPSLAAALRENGLTLTGGGVFQQPRGQGGQAQPGGNASAGGGDGTRDGGADATPAVAAVRRVRHPGQLDVFA
jgi:flagellar hook-length control protein FliK